MNDTLAGWLQVLALVIALCLSFRPLGGYIARVLTTDHHWAAERLIYRAGGVNGDADQKWSVYLRSILAFSAVSVLFLYAFLRLQNHLLLSLGMKPVTTDQSFNTAASFVTNTNWQSYSGESTMGHLVQMAGLAVQNFVSAAVGIAVVAALIRGFSRKATDRVGNFWVDLTRIVLRVLLPLAFVFAIVLVAAGAVQNFHGIHDITTIAGGNQSMTGGPVASQESIKELGTNGGGFYNANSAHPFENPNAFTNLIEIYLMLVIAFSLPRTFGTMIGDHRQGYAIVAVMALIWGASVAIVTANELHSVSSAAGHAAGGMMEGKETRFGIWASALFAVSTTLTSCGAVNSFHDSYTPGGGGMTIFNMMLGEIAPGGSRLRALRDPDPGDRRGVRRRTDGRPYARVPGQEASGPGDEVRVALHPDHARARADRCGAGDGVPGGEGGHAQFRAARLLRGPVRLRVGCEQQRLGVRGAERQYRLVQHRSWCGHACRPVPADGVRPGTQPARLPGSSLFRSPRAPCPLTGRSSSGC